MSTEPTRHEIADTEPIDEVSGDRTGQVSKEHEQGKYEGNIGNRARSRTAAQPEISEGHIEKVDMTIIARTPQRNESTGCHDRDRTFFSRI